MFYYGLGIVVAGLVAYLNPGMSPVHLVWVGAGFIVAAAVNAGIKAWIRSKP